MDHRPTSVSMSDLMDQDLKKMFAHLCSGVIWTLPFYRENATLVNVLTISTHYILLYNHNLGMTAATQVDRRSPGL